MIILRRRGAAGQQYAIIVGLISVIAILAVTQMGSGVKSLMTNTGNTLTNVVNGTVGSGGSGGSSPPPPPSTCSIVRASCQAHLTAGCTTDGSYPVDPDGGGALAQLSVFCDMSTDGGGWTLVYKNQGPTALAYNNTGDQSTLSCLADTSTGCSAKVNDAWINAVGATGSGTAIAYRMTSPNIANKYFFPKGCTYTHDSCGNNWGSGSGACSSANVSFCTRYATSYSVSPSYIQCQAWGGNGAGLNAWYGCNGGPYTNVAITHRSNSSPSPVQYAGITTNSAGSSLGSDSTNYGNSVYMWLR